jgi:hypothetical protein
MSLHVLQSLRRVCRLTVSSCLWHFATVSSPFHPGMPQLRKYVVLCTVCPCYMFVMLYWYHELLRKSSVCIEVMPYVCKLFTVMGANHKHLLPLSICHRTVQRIKSRIVNRESPVNVVEHVASTCCIN